MAHRLITSRQDRLLKIVEGVGKDSAFRHKEQMFVVDELSLVRDLIAAGQKDSVEAVTFSEGALDISAIREMISVFDESIVSQISTEMMEVISPRSIHTDVLLLVREFPSERLTSEKFVVLLDTVRDEEVLGDIIRSASTMGAEAVICSPECADAWSPTALSHGRSMHFKIKVIEAVDLHKIADVFEGRIVCTHLDKESQSLYDADLTGRVALCFGGADFGSREYCQEKVYVPMKHAAVTLDLRVLAGMSISEKVRQDLL